MTTKNMSSYEVRRLKMSNSVDKAIDQGAYYCAKKNEGLGVFIGEIRCTELFVKDWRLSSVALNVSSGPTSNIYITNKL